MRGAFELRCVRWYLCLARRQLKIGDPSTASKWVQGTEAPDPPCFPSSLAKIVVGWAGALGPVTWAIS